MNLGPKINIIILSNSVFTLYCCLPCFFTFSFRCTPVYQRATIQILAQFGAKSGQGQLTCMLGSCDWFVDVTDLVHDSLRIENSQVAALHEKNYVIGLEPGVTSLNVSI